MRLGRVDDETTANLGLIEGGRARNIVPNQVIVRGEAARATTPNWNARSSTWCNVSKGGAARRVTLEGRRFNASLEYRRAYRVRGDEPPRRRPDRAQSGGSGTAAGRVVKPEATGGACDANILNRRGLMVANLGTGMRDIHTVREWLDINDMVSTAEVTLELIAASRRVDEAAPSSTDRFAARLDNGRHRVHVVLHPVWRGLQLRRVLSPDGHGVRREPHANRRGLLDHRRHL